MDVSLKEKILYFKNAEQVINVDFLLRLCPAETVSIHGRNQDCLNIGSG